MSNTDLSDSDRIALLEKRMGVIEAALTRVLDMAKRNPVISKLIDLTKIDL